MENLIDLEKFVNTTGTVHPLEDDDFTNEFEGTCIGIRHGLLQMRDMEDNVWEVELKQFTPDHVSVEEG